MSEGLTTVRTASKDILARCMAAEDITVIHSADTPSAYFDTQSRTLCLPVWEDMDDSLYDMLVGHEVSHALHTPATGWQDFVGDGPDRGTRHMFLNVVEDARIERLIKDSFPGLRRDFAAAYRNLHDRDLFELDGKNIADLPLIDRLNLYFKIGLYGLEDVPFSDDEKDAVRRMAEAKTFQEVEDLARDLYEQYREDNPREEQQEQDQGQEGQGSGTGEDSDGTGSSAGNDSSETDESDESSSSAAGADEDGDESDSGDSQDGESGTDSGQSSADNTDDGESADSQDGESQQPNEGQNDLSYDAYSNESCDAGVGTTQQAYDDAVRDLRDDSGTEYSYHTLPAPILENIIVDHRTVASIWESVSVNDDRWNDSDNVQTRADNCANLQQFLNKSKPTVNHMVQQFQMKQAADADKRTSIAKTGVLDTVSMINYRWSEDIFVKNEVHNDGKSHGLVIFLDWSGSMSGILKDTIEQLLVLVEFCRKVGIPYDVYAFSSQLYMEGIQNANRWDNEEASLRSEAEDRSQWNRTLETDVAPHTFQLYQFLASSMTASEYKTALRNLWLLADCQGYGCYHPSPSCLRLGSTPLNEAVISALEILPRFQSDHGVQIVNAIFLTDGEGHGVGLGSYYRYAETRNILRDKVSRKTWEVQHGHGGETNALLTLLKERTGCNTIGIRLHCDKTIRNLRYSYWNDNDDAFMDAFDSYRKNHFAEIPSEYDAFFVVQGTVKVEFDAMEELDDNASYTRIKNAFIKGNNTKKSSRVIANRIVDIIAV